MLELPLDFVKRMKTILGTEYPAFEKTYLRTSEKGIRVNTLKVSAEKFKEISPVEIGGEIPWEKSGFYTSADGLGKTVLHFAGTYYIQEPSAMSAVPALCVKPGEKVLDLCSAPGGKGTQIAQYMKGEGVLVLNEINFKRYEILKQNVERIGVKNVLVTCAEPSKLAEIFESYFDKILVDAPCSGEGMFKKEAAAIPEWSLANVRMCAERQNVILDYADKMLSEGGKLVYSTCTFSPEEDELQIEKFLKTHSAYELCAMEKLYPHKVRGEGHFYAAVIKTSGERREIPKVIVNDAKQDLKLYREWEKETLNIALKNVVNKSSKLYCMADVPDIDGIICTKGFYLGNLSVDGKRFEPSHRLAMCLKANEVKHIDVDERTALSYMRGLTFECDCNERGWRAVTFKGFPLGWCKAAGGTAKNHLPKGLRI